LQKRTQQKRRNMKKKPERSSSIRLKYYLTENPTLTFSLLWKHQI